jgi:hypothetical protein
MKGANVANLSLKRNRLNLSWSPSRASFLSLSKGSLRHRLFRDLNGKFAQIPSEFLAFMPVVFYPLGR